MKSPQESGLWPCNFRESIGHTSGHLSLTEINIRRQTHDSIRRHSFIWQYLLKLPLQLIRKFDIDSLNSLHVLQFYALSIRKCFEGCFDVGYIVIQRFFIAVLDFSNLICSSCLHHQFKRIKFVFRVI